MPDMKNSEIQWIGEIPTNWNLMRLQFCLKEVNVKNNPIQTTQVLSLMKDIGVLPYEEKGDIGNKAKENVSEYHLAYPNTIVLNCMNILIGSVGISNYFGCVSPVYYVFKETDKCDLRFINYIFNTREFQKELRKYAKGILEIRLRVSADDIFKRKVPLPSKEEQIRIADFLDTQCSEIESLIANIQSQIDTLEEYKKSIIRETVTKGLNPSARMKNSGLAFIGNTPEHWEIKRTKYLATSLSKGNGITKEQVFEDGDIQCVRYGEIYSKYEQSFDNTISLTKLKQISSPKFIHHGDILFAGTGELVEEIGKNIVYMGKEPCLAGGDIVVLKHTQNPRFLNYALNSTYSQEQKSKGKAKLKVVHISATDIGNVLITIPPIDEQNEIADFLDKTCDEINLSIADKKSQLEILADYKKSLIYEYVTGKKQVKENA